MSLRVVVVAADRGVAETAGLYLQQIECELVLATEVGAGAHHDAPVAIICVSSIDQARQFVSATRAALAEPRAVVVFGAGLDPVQAVEMGAIAMVPHGCRPIDLCVIVALAAVSAWGDLRISGEADDYGGVLALVRALSVARRTGKLDLTCGERQGHVNLFDGQVVSVVDGKTKGEAAFYQLARWPRSHFSFADRPKPFVTAELLERAEELGAPPSPAAAAPEPATRSSRPDTAPDFAEPEEISGVVLYVDASRVMQRCAEITFHCTELLYVGARSAAEALELIKQYEPLVVLTDISLPQMSGYELCAAITGDPKTASTPVVLMRGPSRPWDPARARSVGAAGALEKPWDTGELIHGVRRLIAGGVSSAAS